MIITIGGPPGSGKSTVGKLLAQRLGIPFFSTGSIRRQYAMERGMSLQELNKKALTDPDSDRLADAYQAELPQKHDSFILDGKLAYYFVPQSVKVYIDVDLRLGAERIFNQHRPEEHWSSVEEGMAALQERERNGQQRYWNLYRTNPHDKAQFDLVVDGGRGADAVVREILAYLEQHQFMPGKSL